MQLRSLVRSLPCLHACDFGDKATLEIRGIAHDSRRVRAGYIFFALVGTARDGHDYVASAISRGAVAVVAERPVSAAANVPQILVRHTRRALAEVSHRFFGRPSSAMDVVGITGTNGKTSVAHLCRSILRAGGHSCGLLGTIEYDTIRRTLPAGMTTPESMDIHQFLHEMAAEGGRHAVMEVSSHALDQHRTDFVRFAVGVFTNLTQDHLDYHGGMGAYREAKARLFEGLGPRSWAVLNADDPEHDFFAGRSCAGKIRYGLGEGADVRAVIRHASLDGVVFRLISPIGQATVRSSLVGRHNVYNALAAASCGVALGLDLDAIRAGIEEMPPVPGRLERVDCGQPFQVLVDYAHTPDALESVLSSLKDLVPGRLIVVFGAGGARDRKKRPLMGRAVEAKADLAWITSDNPRTEAPQDIIDDILAGITRRMLFRTEPDRGLAIRAALAAALPGDLVLIAGKGHETTQVLRDRAVPFDDREVARAALERVRRRLGA